MVICKCMASVFAVVLDGMNGSSNWMTWLIFSGVIQSSAGAEVHSYGSRNKWQVGKQRLHE